MGIGITDNSGDLNGWGINTNHEARVNLSTTSVTSGFATVQSEDDAGTVTGARQVRTLNLSQDFRTRVGQDSLLFNAFFPGTSFDSTNWTVVLSTMTASQAAGILTLNAGNATASGNVARVQTYRSFPVYGAFGLYGEFLVQFSQLPQSNNVCEWGYGLASGVTAPTDGCFFRLGTDGTFKCVVSYNGTENVSSDLMSLVQPGVATTKHYIINITEDSVEFWIDDIEVARLGRPTGAYSTSLPGQLPVFFRNYNNGIPGVAQQMKVSMVNISLADANRAKDWNDVMAGMGGSAYQAQFGATMGSIAVYGNSTFPAAGTATNTTAAIGSGLGGLFVSNVGVLTHNTDYIISSYQVPLASTAVPGKTLYVNGVGIDTINIGAASGGTGPVTWMNSIAFGHNTVSLASAESVTTKSPRRVPLNVAYMPGTSPINTVAITNMPYRSFQTPIVVQPGEFIQVAQRFLGTLFTTAGQLQTHQVYIDGYFE